MPTPKKETAKVLQILGSGLRIKTISSKTFGFVHKSEFSWDESYFSEKPVFEINQKIEVVFLKYDSVKQRNLFSIRKAYGIPWETRIGDYKKGENVIAEVTGITSREIYCQIEPGIKGIIPPAYIPFGTQSPLTELFARGDKVFAQIKHFDDDKQRIDLSILDCLTDINHNPDHRKELHKTLFNHHAIPTSQDTIYHKSQNGKQYHPPLTQLVEVLIIDDEQSHLDNISTWLKSNFPTIEKIKKAKSLTEALSLLKKEVSPDLIIMDLRLKNGNGLDTAKKIFEYHPDQQVLFTSSDPYGHIDVHAAFKTKYPFASKIKSELISAINKWINGILEQIPLEFFLKKQTLLSDVGFEHEVQSIGVEQINNLVKELKLETQAANVFLLDVNEDKETAKIIASAPFLKRDIMEYAESIIFFSPVREIVMEERISFDTFVDMEDSKYKNFFPFLQYTSYYGMPLKSPGIPIRHVLILFFNEKNIISGNLIRQIRAKATLIQAILEKMQVADIAQRYASTYLKGQLLSSMIHELNNKIGGLKNYVNYLKETFGVSSELLAQTDLSVEVPSLHYAANKLNEAYQSIEDLVSSYGKMDKGEFGLVNINQVTKKVIQQLQSEIKSHPGILSLQIIEELDEQVPKVWSIEGRLEQVIVNIVLNAIQQANIQASNYEMLEQKAEYQAPFKENFIFIKSSIDTDKNVCQLYILDTGPGVNYNNREKIFHLGVSSRGEGHGLGLYISRNLISQMGGKIELLDSILFIGSLFKIEVPLNSDDHGSK